MKFTKPLLLAVALAAAAGGLAWYWHRQTIFPSTDEPYLQANVLTISPQVSAGVVEVSATEGARVAAGDVLVRLDDRAFNAAIAAASATAASPPRTSRSWASAWRCSA